MAYAAAPGQPVAPKTRPAVVTAACWLLYFAAACQVVLAIIAISQLGTTKEAYQKAYADSTVKGAADVAVAVAATVIAIGFLLAIGYVVLAILDGRGKNPARIVTWVIGGVSICCSAGSVVSNASGLSSMGGGGGNGAPSGKQIQDAMNAALPGWYQPVLTTIGLIAIFALVAVVILLALPAANDFFRKPKQQVWEPPTPSVPPPTA
jgi:hypothetical protein